MSADLVLHALADTPQARDALKRLRLAFAANEAMWGGLDEDKGLPASHWEISDELIEARDAVYELTIEHIQIGECSYAKASMLGDYDKYVPAAVARVAAIVPEDDVVALTSRLITQIMVAMNVANTSWYSKRGWGREGVSKRRDVKRRLESLPTGTLLRSELE